MMDIREKAEGQNTKMADGCLEKRQKDRIRKWMMDVREKAERQSQSGKGKGRMRKMKIYYKPTKSVKNYYRTKYAEIGL